MVTHLGRREAGVGKTNKRDSTWTSGEEERWEFLLCHTPSVCCSSGIWVAQSGWSSHKNRCLSGGCTGQDYRHTWERSERSNNADNFFHTVSTTQKMIGFVGNNAEKHTWTEIGVLLHLVGQRHGKISGVVGKNADNFSKLLATMLKNFWYCRQQRGTITTTPVNILKSNTSL
jgi:hypothetical protein